MKTLIAISSIFFSLQVFAHEGHDQVPGAISAPHGGLVQQAGPVMLELLSTPEGVQIYPYDHDMQPVPLANAKLEGKMTLPKKGKGEPVKFSSDGDKYVAKIDAKGSHRYTLELSVDNAGKKSKAKFNVEPQQ